MKKIVSFLSLIIVFFNLIFCNNCCAFDLDISGDDISEYVQSGIATDNVQNDSGNDVQIKNSTGMDLTKGTVLSAIVGSLFSVLNIFPMCIQEWMTMFASIGNPDAGIITIEAMVFNEVKMFQIDFFNFDQNDPTIIKNMKESVAKFFYINRLIAVALSLITLIYVGIRMALSSTSNDTNKYKKMFFGWCESVAILFFLHWIISALLYIGNIFSNTLLAMRAAESGISFESVVISSVYTLMFTKVGWDYVLYAILFSLLVFIQLKFFFTYLKRMLTVAFLIIISPLVTVVYSIDKAGDGKAQSFNNWMNELSVNIFIQPIEALVYLVFMYTASEIAETSILIAGLFLLSLTKVEKIIFQLFNVKGMSLHIAHDEKMKG